MSVIIPVGRGREDIRLTTSSTAQDVYIPRKLLECLENRLIRNEIAIAAHVSDHMVSRKIVREDLFRRQGTQFFQCHMFRVKSDIFDKFGSLLFRHLHGGILHVAPEHALGDDSPYSSLCRRACRDSR